MVSQAPGLSPLVELLRCLECSGPLALEELASAPGYPELGPDGWLACPSCGERYPIIAGTPRMLTKRLRAALAADYPLAGINLGLTQPPLDKSVKRRTAESFAYEWRAFGQPRPEWRQNFLDYLRPHSPHFLTGKLVLDVGTGSGRHSAQAAFAGASVAAVDLGRSIDVARANVPPDVLTVQADAERLPFAPQTFDFVMSLGVLHHLEDPARALRSVTRFVKAGGRLHVYLY